MDWEQFARSLRKGETARAYLLTGDDRYLKKRSLEQLEGVLFPNGKAEISRYEAPAGLAEAVRDAQTYPFFTGMRLVVVEKAETIGPDAKKILAPLLAHPPEFTTMVFVAGEDIGSKRWTNWFKKGIKEVVCSADPRSIRRWIEGWFRKQGLRAGPTAVSLLEERSGGRFGSIVSDLEKLALICPAGGTVTAQMVREGALDHSEEQIFTLTTALLKRDRAAGVQALEDLLGQGQQPGQILVMLAKSLKLRWALSDPAAPRSDEEIARAVRLSPRWVGTARRKGERADPEQARRLWEALETADRRLKTSAHNEAMVLLAAIEPAFGDGAQG